MSRVTKWKLEKTKVKVVFRLQFHATHIPLSGWDKLIISFIPADSGKATAKTTKANVRNGTCKWGDPIYETTRLLQDSRSKQYEEKLYKLVIAMGSSRSSILGEATINLADYADALKPCHISLPLYGCDSGTTLHVTVQLLTSKTGFREFEQQREHRERGLTDQGNLDEFSGGKLLLSEDTTSDQVPSRVRFKEKFKDLAPLGAETGPNEGYTESAVGFDGSSNTSESHYAEKHDASSTHEIDSLKSTVSGDLALYPVSQGSQPEKGDPSNSRFSGQATNDWVHRWNSEYSADSDFAAAYEENTRLRGSLEIADSSIIELKMELNSLQSYADEIGHEAQKFSKQLAAEFYSGKELAKEVSVLKLEGSKLKADLELLKVSKSSCSLVEQDHIIQDLHLGWLKGISILEEKVGDIQNKASLVYPERDFRFPHSDLESMLTVLQNLRQATELAASGLNFTPSDGSSMKDKREMSVHSNGKFVAGTGYDLDMYQPEIGMLHCLSIPGLVSQSPDSVDSISGMKGKIFELLRELDESKAETESLTKKMDQMECYYESLVQELEENQRQMLGELQNLKNEHSTSLYLVSSTKAEMETICHGLNEQISRLTEDKSNLISFSEELERRALTAESALKRARLNYSIAVDHLQKDLELLSSQVVTMFETSENLVRKAFFDNSETIQGPLEVEHMRKFGSGVGKVSPLQKQLSFSERQHRGEDIFSDDLRKSLHLQEGLYRKVDEEVFEVHSVNIYLDVLSKVLVETLLRAQNEIKLMNEKVIGLMQQLALSTESKELFKKKLQSAEDDIHFLDECNSTGIAKCTDLSRQNTILETHVQDLTHQNILLVQKVTEWEVLVKQCSLYESKLEAMVEEKAEMAYLLENKTLENGNLQNEISILQEEFKSVRNEYNVLLSTEKDLQNFVKHIHNNLQNLITSYNRSLKEMSPDGASYIQNLESLELSDCVVILEKLQRSTDQRIMQLMEDKEALLHAKEVAQVSVSEAQSEIALMRQRFEHEIHNMVKKLDMSNALVQKLHKSMEAITHKLEFSFEVEEKHAQQCSDLFSDLERLEVELHEITSNNSGIAQDILLLETLTGELGNSDLAAAELMKENQSLSAGLQEKTLAVANFSSELNSLKDSFLSLHEENRALIRSIGKKDQESEQLALELNTMRTSLQSLSDENQALRVSIQNESKEAAKLASELNHSKANLQLLHEKNHVLEVSLQAEMEKSTELVLEVDNFTECLRNLQEENRALLASMQDKSQESTILVSELNVLKEQLQSLDDENRILKVSLRVEKEGSEKISLEVNGLKESIQSLHDEKQTLILSSEKKDNEAAELAIELNALKDMQQFLHDEHQSLLVCSRDRSEESANLLSELHILRESLQSQRDENQALKESSQSKAEELEQIAQELSSMKVKFQSLRDELLKEKCLRDSSENKVGELTLELTEKENQLLKLQQCESEVLHLKQVVSDLQSEKSKLQHLRLHSEECLKQCLKQSHSVPGLEAQLFEMYELVVAADIKLVYIKTRYEGRVEELVRELCSSDILLADLHRKQTGSEAVLNQSLAAEEHYIKENSRLLTSLESLKSELEALTSENNLLLEASKAARAGLEGYESRAQTLEIASCRDKCQYSAEDLWPKLQSVSEEEIDDLIFCKGELEVSILVLKAKLQEQQADIVLLEQCREEFLVLQQEYDELAQKLSEQSQKTEEFRNLSLHLKKLKDKAEAEHNQALEKREPEGPSFVRQDSLRVAFMKEQHETKLQEMKQQLSISKKHSEEMLWKLQDALNEIESRKKAEASHLKKNEELGMHILDLEAELQSVLSDKREKVNAYDLMKAEMECSLISLECCKEEKQKLEAALQQSCEEKSRIEAELILMKELPEQAKASRTRNGTFSEEEGTSPIKPLCINVNQKSVIGNVVPGSRGINIAPAVDATENPGLKNSERDGSNTCGEAENRYQSSPDKLYRDSTLVDIQSDQGTSTSVVEKGPCTPAVQTEQNLLNGDMKHLALINDRFRAEGLRSSMDHLSNELERMKNDNLIILLDDQDFDQKFPDLQRELIHLQKADEELGNMFPNYNEFARSGNAMERVLALEIELAEALQTKKRSSIHFQSSFLKQHSDEEAVFKSFKDINELIKDMLEIKGRYAAVEGELKDMHDRYSELSLRFAEVEGERQKLKMTLKNVRSSKRSPLLDRSSSELLGENFS